MPERLSETYAPGDLVEIMLRVDGAEQWVPGRVIGPQHPGLWVRAADGGAWFVTNTRRIRRPARRPPPAPPEL